MKGKRLANFIVKVISKKKGRDIVLIDVRKMTALTDFFVVCTAEVAEHADSIEEELKKELKGKGNTLFGEEGEQSNDWIVMDYGDVIVHIMTEEKRKFYNIEKIWQRITPSFQRKRKF